MIQQGHTCIALDLPGHGADHTPLGRVTHAMNVAAIVNELQRVDHPATVVAHSLGGISATEAAAIVPDRMQRIVYVAALVPLNGESMADLPQRDPGDPVSDLIKRDDAAGILTFKKEGATQALFSECPPDVAADAVNRLEHESIAATEGAAQFPGGCFPSSIPRTYVVCVRDRTITAKRQQQILRRAGCKDVRVIYSDHSPFLSRPSELAQALLSSASGH